jgi:hypothetical protein
MGTPSPMPCSPARPHACHQRLAENMAPQEDAGGGNPPPCSGKGGGFTADKKNLAGGS